MRNRQLVATAVFVVAVVAAVGLPVAATSAPALANETDGGGMGTQLTAFLQSSSAATDDTVENGMWKAGFDRANESDRARMVQNRTDGLTTRLARLQERNETLTERYRNGSLPEPAYVAQQSRLAARIDSLQAAVNDTEVAAGRAGVNSTQLMQLRRNASEMAGPAVAAVARGVVGGPDERGSRGNGAGGPPNGSVGPPADRGGGPPANATDGSRQGGPGGSDGTSGNSTANGNQPGDRGDGAKGNGNGTAGGDGNGGKGNGNEGGGGRDGADGNGNDNAEDGNGNDDAGDGGDGNGDDNAGDGGDGDAGDGGGENSGDGNGGAGSSDS